MSAHCEHSRRRIWHLSVSLLRACVSVHSHRPHVCHYIALSQRAPNSLVSSNTILSAFQSQNIMQDSQHMSVVGHCYSPHFHVDDAGCDQKFADVAL